MTSPHNPGEAKQEVGFGSEYRYGLIKMTADAFKNLTAMPFEKCGARFPFRPLG